MRPNVHVTGNCKLKEDLELRPYLVEPLRSTSIASDFIYPAYRWDPLLRTGIGHIIAEQQCKLLEAVSKAESVYASWPLLLTMLHESPS